MWRVAGAAEGQARVEQAGAEPETARRGHEVHLAQLEDLGRDREDAGGAEDGSGLVDGDEEGAAALGVGGRQLAHLVVGGAADAEGQPELGERGADDPDHRVDVGSGDRADGEGHVRSVLRLTAAINRPRRP